MKNEAEYLRELISMLTVDTPLGNQGSEDMTVVLGAILEDLRIKASDEARSTPRRAAE